MNDAEEPSETWRDATTRRRAHWLLLSLSMLGSLYLAIWLHELGHSVVAWAFGCKASWWQTDVSWFLWSSWSGETDELCLERSGPMAVGSTAIAGILVNLVLLAGVTFAARRLARGEPQSRAVDFRVVPLVTWALANYAEAFSYLVLNTLWLKSDMHEVVGASGWSRWTWLGLGSLLAMACAAVLRRPVAVAAEAIGEGRFRRGWIATLIAYGILTALGMFLARWTLT